MKAVQKGAGTLWAQPLEVIIMNGTWSDGVGKPCVTVAAALLLVVCFAGCMSPVGPNQMGGAFIGGATGAFMGAAIDGSPEGALVGATIGALAGALVGKDVDENTRTRVDRGQPLQLEDIKNLAKAGVSDDLIISQINATRTVYLLKSGQIIDLKESGVSSEVIDYMISTPDVFSGPPAGAGYYQHAPSPVYVPMYTPYPYYYRAPVRRSHRRWYHR